MLLGWSNKHNTEDKFYYAVIFIIGELDNMKYWSYLTNFIHSLLSSSFRSFEEHESRTAEMGCNVQQTQLCGAIVDDMPSTHFIRV